MNKKRLSLIAAVLLVALGTVALVKYVSTAEDRALAGEELVDVLVLDADVPAGTSATELQNFLRVESVPVKVQAAGALASLSEAEGLVVSVDLVRGEQLTAGRLIEATEYNALQARIGRGGGTVQVPEGLLEITIPLDPIRTVGGTLRPGDLVGIIANFTGYKGAGVPAEGGGEVTGFLLHKVLVTNVQGTPVAEVSREASTAARTAAPAGTMLVTLAVPASDAEKIVFASSYGSLWMAIEPADADEAGTKIRVKDEIFN